MKIKVFTTDKNGKICLSKDELQEIINEAYWEGYNNGAKNGNTWTISTTPWVTTPYYTWSTTTNGSASITIGTDNMATSTIINTNDITKDSIYINTAKNNNVNLDNYSDETNMKVSC